MKKGLCFPIIIVLLNCSLAHSVLATGLKQYTLGMTLSEMKKLPAPVRADYPKDKFFFACDGDKFGKALDLKAWPRMTVRSDLAAIGVILCGYVQRHSESGMNSYAGYSIPIAGGPTAELTFFFMPEDQAKERKLLEIRAELSSRDYASIRGPMLAKYGNPDGTDNATAVNGFGATYNDEVLTWSLPGARIVLRELDGNVNTSSITYTDLDLEERVNELLLDAAKKAAGDL